MGLQTDKETMKKGKEVVVSSPNTNDDDDNLNISEEDLDDDNNHNRGSGVSFTSVRFSSRNTSSKYDFVKVLHFLPISPLFGSRENQTRKFFVL